MKSIRTGILLSSLGLAIAGSAQAATITVNTLTDDGAGDCTATCTLRDAIATATAGDTIAVDVSGTIILDSAKGEIVLDKDLTLAGRGKALTSVSGNDLIRIFNATAGSIEIRELTLEHGLSKGADASGPTGGAFNGEGGAVRIGENATVVLKDVTLANNKAVGGNGGNAYEGAGGGGGGVGGNGAGYAGTRGDGSYGGGGAGASFGGLSSGGTGGFGAGGGGGQSSGAGGTPGTGGGAGGGGVGNGYGGGGGGAGFGGAIYVEGALGLLDVDFIDNEARGGNGGTNHNNAGGGGGGAGMGSAIFSRGDAVTGTVCILRGVTFAGGVVAGGYGSTRAGSGSGLETSTGMYEAGSSACPMTATDVDAEAATARQTEQTILFSASVMPAAVTGYVTFQVKDPAGNVIGAPVSAPTYAGRAFAFYALPATTAGEYTIEATFENAYGVHAGSSAMATLTLTPAPIVFRTSFLGISSTCPVGGALVESGHDDGLPTGIEFDGILQDGEVDTTEALCPEEGEPDAVLKVETVLEAGDEACPHGGTLIEVGVDDGRNGSVEGDGELQDGEIAQSTVVCKDAPVVLTRETAIEAGDEACPHGGTLLEAGVDDGRNGSTAGDGVLQDGEVGESAAVCNEAPVTTPAPAGDEGGCASSPGAQGAWPLVVLLALLWLRARRQQA